MLSRIINLFKSSEATEEPVKKFEKEGEPVNASVLSDSKGGGQLPLGLIENGVEGPIPARKLCELNYLKDIMSQQDAEVLDKCFSRMEISVRCLNVLNREDVSTPRDFLALDNSKIVSWKGFGERSIKDLVFVFSSSNNNVIQANTDFNQLKTILKTLEPSVLETDFQAFDLPVRALNVFKRENIRIPRELLDIDEKEALSWSGFGKTSVKQLQSFFINQPKKSIDCDYTETSLIGWVLELDQEHPELTEHLKSLGVFSEKTFLENRYLMKESLIDIENFRFNELLKAINTESPYALIRICPSWLLEIDLKYFECDTKVSNFLSTHSIKKLGDLNDFSEAKYFQTKGFGKVVVRNLAKFIIGAVDKGLPPELGGMDALHENVEHAFLTSLQNLEDERQRDVLNKRFGIECEAETLEEVAQRYGLTRERVRQIQKKAVKTLINKEFWDDYLESELQKLFDQRTDPLYLDELSTHNQWLEGFSDKPKTYVSIIESFTNLEFKFLEIEGRFLISNLSADEWHKLKSDLRDYFESTIDFKHSYDDIELTIEHNLAEKSSAELSAVLLDQLSKDFNFSLLDGEMVLSSVGNTVTSKIRTILEESDQPIHMHEIYKRYLERYDADAKERYITSRFGHPQFCGFDRGVYGLKKHLTINDNRQSEILKEVVELIKANPNKQWGCNEIIKHLKLQDINKYELNIILKESNELVDLGRLIWAHIDSGFAGDRIQLKDVIKDILTENGQEMELAELEAKIKKTRSVGKFFSVSMQPNEVFSKINPTTWGLIERDFILTPQEWEPIKRELLEKLDTSNQSYHRSEVLSVVQNMSNNSDLTTGHIIGVVAADPRFKMWRGGFISPSTWSERKRYTLEEAIDKAIEKFEYSTFSSKEIYNAVEEILGYEYKKSRISPILNSKSYAFSKDRFLWEPVV